jgi:hypothetical protein
MSRGTAVLLWVLAGCSRPALPTAVDAGPPPDDCTLATVLVPGIPGSPGHFLLSERNPNGDSELAALMRRFVDDWKDARVKLDAGLPLTPRLAVHRKMRCSWPTAAADRNAQFDGYAIGYLAKVKAFDAQPSRDTYEGVLDGCKACHSVTCGGPLEVIEGLRWK